MSFPLEPFNRPAGTSVSFGAIPGTALRPHTAGELRAGLITVAAPRLKDAVTSGHLQKAQPDTLRSLRAGPAFWSSVHHIE